MRRYVDTFSNIVYVIANPKPNPSPNQEPPAEWDEVIAHFRGGELQAFLTRLLDHGMRAATKLQLVDLLARHLPTQVDQLVRVTRTLTLSKPTPEP